MIRLATARRPYRIPWKRGGIENIDGFGVGTQKRCQLPVLQVRGVIRVGDVVVLAHHGVGVFRRRCRGRPSGFCIFALLTGS